MISTIATFVFWLAAVILLGRFELHTDDAGVEVCLILLFTFILGCWHPKRAWGSALLGLSVPMAQLFWSRSAPSASRIAGLGMLAAFVTVAGLIGSYSGVFVRRAVMRLGR